MKKILLTIICLMLNQALRAQILIDTADYIEKNAQLYSLLISKNDEIIYSKYFNKQDETKLFNNQSLTKSITALLIGIAIDKGYIKSVDQKITDFFPELKADADNRKQEITIRQIMNQASGLYHEGRNVSALFKIPDLSGYVLKAPLVSDPGQLFLYNNAGSHLLSVILTKSTGMSTLSFARKFLFDPLAISNVDWKKMKDGYYDGSGLASIYLGSADMMKLGNLVMNNGRYGNSQIISSDWITSIINPEITYATKWGFPDSRYSLCWYHASYQGVKITYALGWGGQFMFIIPSLKTVVVTNSNVNDRTAIKQAAMITDKLFPEILKLVKD